MTAQLYRYITKTCFIIGAVAVFCFDRFPGSILPEIFLIGAALLSGGVYIFSRVKPLKFQDEDADLPQAPPNIAGLTISEPSYSASKAYMDFAASAILREKPLRKTDIELLTSLEAKEVALHYWVKTIAAHKASSSQSYVKNVTLLNENLKKRIEFRVSTPTRPQLSPAETAIQIVKSLGSTDYDVTLTPDGAIKIRRVAKKQPSEARIEQQQSFNLDNWNPATSVQ